MSTSIAAGVDDIPCFIALILKFLNLSLYLLLILVASHIF